VIDRIDALTAPGVTNGLAQRQDVALRDMKDEACAVENAVSYLRRLAQARIEILGAEQQRRREGGSVSELIGRLPEILAGAGGRANPGSSRLVEPDSTITELRWPDGREQLVTGDASLASLPDTSDDDLAATLAQLEQFERELSDDRKRLHDVIQSVERELATRAAADV
jgi:hypothetical protein